MAARKGVISTRLSSFSSDLKSLPFLSVIFTAVRDLGLVTVFSCLFGLDVLDALQIGIEAKRNGDGGEFHHEVPEVDEVLFGDLELVLELLVALVGGVVINPEANGANNDQP